MLSTLEIRCDEDDFFTDYGRIGDPPDLSGKVEQTFLVTVDVLAKCFQSNGFWSGDVLACADRQGKMIIARHDGVWIYELFPALSADPDLASGLYLAVRSD